MTINLSTFFTTAGSPSPLPVVNGGTGSTTSTGTGSVVLQDGPTLNAPVIGAATGTSVVLSGTNPNSMTVNSASAALTVTQTGAGNAFVVEDATSPDSTPFVVNGVGVIGLGMSPPASAGTSGIFSTGDISLSGSSRGFLGNLYYQAGWKFVDNGYGYGIYDSSGAITFNTAGLNAGGAGAAATLTERMRIDSAGNVWIGSTPVAGQILTIGKQLTGASTSLFNNINADIANDVTGTAVGYRANLRTANGTALTNLYQFHAVQSSLGTGTIVTQIGFLADTSLIGATNNYGFYSNIASGTGRWNFYAAGTAANYFAGVTSIGAAQSVAQLYSYVADGGYPLGVAGTTKGIRFSTNSGTSRITGVDNTLVATYQPLAIGGSTLSFETNGATTALTIDASQTVAPQKLLDISGASAGQIKFPATQNASADANTLDDYEEGTWTAVLSDGTNNATSSHIFN